jgi:NADPH-dependent curcumin reductase CurA
VVLDAYAPAGPIAEPHFSVQESALPETAAGQVLLQTMTLSVDLYMRSCMTGVDNFFLPQLEVGKPIYSRGVARVVESRRPGYTRGDLVVGTLDWSEMSLWSGGDRMLGRDAVLQPLDSRIAKPSHVLGAVGINGVSAFFGVLAVARPRRGETMVVSGAAGGVGSLAGQIAKIQGARVIGLAGSQPKRDLLVKQLGFEAALDYRSEDLVEELLTLAPGGPDINLFHAATSARPLSTCPPTSRTVLVAHRPSRSRSVSSASSDSVGRAGSTIATKAAPARATPAATTHPT